MSMLLDERRESILKIVENKGFVSLVDLMDSVGASESTVRRDLEYLDGIGQIRRTRGGAAYSGESLSTFEDRSFMSSRQKRMIAQAVANMISPGEAVLMDGGTTTLEVARQLVGKQLQVVTNSLPIANLLVNQPQIDLMLIGGFLFPKTGVALGKTAVDSLKSVHVRRLIISVGGITEDGLYNSNMLLVETEQQMFEAAEEVIVVTDSTKFGHSALAYLCPLNTVDHIVVDDGISEKWKSVIRNAGIELTIVET